ncbi:MAG: rhomboid family intramembrane serine protease [bacterium]|nr:rhomboid family intramembrane serine protease [bacterium]
MIPIRDINPSLRRPVITLLLLAASVAVYFVVQPSDPADEIEFLYRQAAIACEQTTGEALSDAEIINQVCTDGAEAPFFPEKSLPLSVIVSMFLHGGLAHLLANMWSLYLFGNNVEDAFGRIGYLILYLVSGVVATAGFVVLNPDTTVPLVGASGAIAGVMGAYLVLFPHARVVSVFPLLFFIPFTVRAGWFLLFWFVGQFAFTFAETGVAWEAHVAGFLFGMVVTIIGRRPLLRRLARLERRRFIRLGYG